MDSNFYRFFFYRFDASPAKLGEAVSRCLSLSLAVSRCLLLSLALSRSLSFSIAYMLDAPPRLKNAPLARTARTS